MLRFSSSLSKERCLSIPPFRIRVIAVSISITASRLNVRPTFRRLSASRVMNGYDRRRQIAARTARRNTRLSRIETRRNVNLPFHRF